MSREELVELGGKIDGVETVFKRTRWPVPGTKAEKRAERAVAYWLLLGGFSGLALLLIFLFWPWEYKPCGSEGEFFYALATPLYGLTFGLSILAIGIGAVLFQKKFIPEEISIQERHDGRSPRSTARPSRPTSPMRWSAQRSSGAKLIGLSLGIGLGAFGLGTLVAFIGGLIKNPWKPVRSDRRGQQGRAVDVGLDPRFKGETIFTGPRHRHSRRVAVRQDAPGGHRRRRHGDGVPVARVRRRRHHRRVARQAHRDRDGRAQPGDADPHQAGRHAQGGQAQGPGELQLRRTVRVHQGVLAFGLPSSLYEQQTYRILCPCHQSQFDALHFARPIFGPAARALAQLPITIDQDGYLVANGDFIEPVGPAFWERRS